MREAEVEEREALELQALGARRLQPEHHLRHHQRRDRQEGGLRAADEVVGDGDGAKLGHRRRRRREQVRGEGLLGEGRPLQPLAQQHPVDRVRVVQLHLVHQRVGIDVGRAQSRRRQRALEQPRDLRLVERAHVLRGHVLDVEGEQQRSLALVARLVRVGHALCEDVDLLEEEHDREPRQLHALILEDAAVDARRVRGEEGRTHVVRAHAAGHPLRVPGIVSDWHEQHGVRPLAIGTAALLAPLLRRGRLVAEVVKVAERQPALGAGEARLWHQHVDAMLEQRCVEAIGDRLQRLGCRPLLGQDRLDRLPGG